MANRRSRRTPSQKWPRGPRFTVGSISGYSTEPHAHCSKEVWYVHDAAYCYRTVGVFHDSRPRGTFDLRLWDRYDGHLYKRRLHQSAEQAARHYALILNQREKEAA